MQLYVYCPRLSESARDLTRALGAVRLRRFDGVRFWHKRRIVGPRAGDAIVCWGTTLPEIDSIRILNATECILNKYQQALVLKSNNISTVAVSKDDRASVEQFTALGYVGRTNRHVGGNDLLTPVQRPDFYTQKWTFARELRIHSFCGRSIRAGVKVPRDGFTPVEASAWRPNSRMTHPWIRSFDGGWKVDYTGFQSTSHQRNLSHKAVKALELTFGAVDIGEAIDKRLIVLEVNTAPGIEGGTLDAYVRAITRWLREPEATVEP